MSFSMVLTYLPIGLALLPQSEHTGLVGTVAPNFLGLTLLGVLKEPTGLFVTVVTVFRGAISAVAFGRDQKHPLYALMSKVVQSLAAGLCMECHCCSRWRLFSVARGRSSTSAAEWFTVANPAQ